MLLGADISSIQAVWFQSALKRFGGSDSFLTISVSFFSAQSLHDLISMTLMKGRGLLEELDGLIGLLKRTRERERIYYCFIATA